MRGMLILRLGLLFAASLLTGCHAAQGDQSGPRRSFGAVGITRVILRAAAADAAVAEPTAGTGSITIAGRAIGGAEGYHPADPTWRETPASEWGLDFVAKRFGITLVISSKNEIDHIHHHYMIADIAVQLPLFVILVRQARILSGSGEADLAPP